MKKWSEKKYDRSLVSKLSLSCGVSSLTAGVLAAKGYSSAESVMERLELHELSDPFLIKDMKIAADAINKAVEEGTHICVYGDYDCDGVMAAVILYSYLLEIGADVSYYIPERSEGYGLNKNAVDKLHEDGVELIVTVDNGISAIEEAEYIYSLGMRLIVTDHHQQGDTLPRAEAVVDPHRHDDCSPFKFACGAFIALKLVSALDDGDYTMSLEQFGDLAAIATVADIVSLTGENRFIVRYGLDLINNTDRPALIALKEVSGLTDKFVDSHSVAFGLAPRINAAGRFGSPKTAMELFLCEDCEEALTLAQELDRLNNARKSAENDIISEIYSILDNDPSILRDRVICVCGKGWHHGVIGITASRIMEKFGKPCFIASEENGELRGSARSFGKFSVFDALTAASEVLEKFGGHPGAGGYTIRSGMGDEFRRLINKFAMENCKDMPLPELSADMTVTSAELTVDNVNGLNVLEPFGTGNEKPLFLIENAEITDVIPLSGGVHSKLKIKLDGVPHDALMFRVQPSELPVQQGDICDMIVTLGTNTFRDKTSVSIFISDIRKHNFEQDKYFAALAAFEAHMRGEELPAKYYPVMLPSRETAATIYKLIPNDGITADNLYFRLSSAKLNYCRFCASIEAMKQLGLIVRSSADSVIRRVKVSQKADLFSAPVLVSIREKINQGNP
ncbi:MAG: single-stranded-DNA-specific exonuclease RecJ [Ruminococcus sp.]|nr:single-stranded-DNA-specific exonuclease RecJ [Ruminococcus sp.]